MDLSEVQVQREWAGECLSHLRVIRSANPKIAREHFYRVIFAIANTISVGGQLPSTTFLEEERKVKCNNKAFDASVDWFERQLQWFVQVGAIPDLPSWTLVRISTRGRVAAVHGFAKRTSPSVICLAPASPVAVADVLDLESEGAWPGGAQQAGEPSGAQEPNQETATEPESLRSSTDRPAGSKSCGADLDQVRDALFVTLIERVTMLRRSVADRLVAASLYCVIGYWVVAAWGGDFSPRAFPDTVPWSSPIDPIWRLLDPITERLCIRAR